jgi:hypothetical protein
MTVPDALASDRKFSRIPLWVTVDIVLVVWAMVAVRTERLLVAK